MSQSQYFHSPAPSCRWRDPRARWAAPGPWTWTPSWLGGSGRPRWGSGRGRTPPPGHTPSSRSAAGPCPSPAPSCWNAGSFVTCHHFVTFRALLQIVTNVSGQYKSMRDSCQRDRPSVTHKKRNPASFFPFVWILRFEKNVFFFNILDFGSVLDVWEIGFKEKTFSELKWGILEYFSRW